MNSEQALLQKLQISKKIMEKHNDINRNTIRESLPNNIEVEDYQPVNANYNIPQEYLSEGALKQQKNITYENTEDKILNSKLPDEIKRLMIEHPIQQPNTPLNSSTLSDDLIEKASRLMNVNGKKELPNQTKNTISENKINIDANEIRKIVRETVEDVLKTNGLLTESETKSNDLFKFRVGQHIFEGKLLKVKKISK